MAKILTAEQALANIKDGSDVASVGVIGWITPDHLLKSLGQRFKNTSSPKDLTFYFPCGTGDAMKIKGMDHVAQEGLMKRIISGSYINPVDPETGERPRLMGLIKANKVEAYSWPIGASMQWLREVARRSPGYMTKIGLGTYIDPEITGGKFTEKAVDDLVEKINFRGEDYLFYPTWSIDTAFIRASSSDEHGNLSFEREAIQSASLALAIAAKASGGQVIAQVERITSENRLASSVKIPRCLVDSVVVDPQQQMVTDVQFNDAYLYPGGSLDVIPDLPPGPMAIFARRAAQEVRRHELSIFGFGASSTVQLAMKEAGMLDEGLHNYPSTTEHGSYGGVVMGAWQFSLMAEKLFIGGETAYA